MTKFRVNCERIDLRKMSNSGKMIIPVQILNIVDETSYKISSPVKNCLNWKMKKCLIPEKRLKMSKRKLTTRKPEIKIEKGIKPNE